MYRHKDGMIYDVEDGLPVATMSESATPEQGAVLAAAPELLAALQALLADAYLSDPINKGRMASAREAVAKATGAVKTAEEQS